MAGICGGAKQRNETVEILADVLPCVSKARMLRTARGSRQMKDDLWFQVCKTIIQLHFRPQIETMAKNVVTEIPKALITGTWTHDNVDLMTGIEAGAGQMRADKTGAPSDEYPRHRALLRGFAPTAAACACCAAAGEERAFSPVCKTCSIDENRGRQRDEKPPPLRSEVLLLHPYLVKEIPGKDKQYVRPVRFQSL